jgi:hypothetical protein
MSLERYWDEISDASEESCTRTEGLLTMQEVRWLFEYQRMDL